MDTILHQETCIVTDVLLQESILIDPSTPKALEQESIDPNNAILYYNLGVINGEQGDFEVFQHLKD